ncbi:MAG: hypothetical protein IJI14_16360 [Anaerolineaceae bacterium]|nr:hypothetical protein [Anaerolineaceae bacterium]
MGLTIILALFGCILLFLGIWGVTITMPTGLLLKNFPEDVQEKLKPRVESLPMSFKRLSGWIILILLIIGYIGIFIAGGIDGKKHGFTFWQFFLRFLMIGGIIKIFDIVCLDYFLLTKTHFFQHYFPETEGCAGWQDFGYNRKQQIRQCILIVIGSAVMAWIFAKL